MGFWKDIWDDVRPNLLWDLTKTFVGAIFMTATWSWIKAEADSPFTKQEAAVVFVTLVILTAIVITVYQVKLRRARQQTGGIVLSPKGTRHNWIWAILTITTLGLLGWNFSLQQQVRHLEVQMMRYVLPRQLAKDQIEKFGQYLKEHSTPHEVKIVYIMGDSESERYASDFASAFRKGSWVPNMNPINPLAINCDLSPPGTIVPVTCRSGLWEMVNTLQGITINQSGPNPPPPATIEEKAHPKPPLHQIVSEALMAGDIRGISAGYGFSNEPLNTITVRIGLRKRDKWAIPPKAFWNRRPEKSPDEITDDDF